MQQSRKFFKSSIAYSVQQAFVNYIVACCLNRKLFDIKIDYDEKRRPMAIADYADFINAVDKLLWAFQAFPC